MGSRTYIPQLVRVLHMVCKYIARYREQILRVVGDSNAEALDGIVTACNVFMAVAEEFIDIGN